MNKAYSIILVVVGATLIYLGIDGTSSLVAALRRFFTHSPTDGAIWLFLTGILVAAAGFFGVWWDRRRFD